MVDLETTVSVVVLEVPGDGVRAGVQPAVGQLLAQPDDQVDGLGRCAVGEVLGRRERGSKAASPSAS